MFYGNGLIIDKDKKRYKKYVSVLFFKVGDWAPLLNFSFVALTKVQGAQTLRSAKTIGALVSFKVDFFRVYLCVDEKRKVLVKKIKNHHEAFILAKGVAKYLGVSLNNYVKED